MDQIGSSESHMLDWAIDAANWWLCMTRWPYRIAANQVFWLVDWISHELDSPIGALIGHSFPRQIRSSNRICDQSFVSTCLGKQGYIEVAVNKLPWKAMFVQLDDMAGKVEGNINWSGRQNWTTWRCSRKIKIWQENWIGRLANQIWPDSDL